MKTIKLYLPFFFWHVISQENWENYKITWSIRLKDKIARKIDKKIIN